MASEDDTLIKLLDDIADELDVGTVTELTKKLHVGRATMRRIIRAKNEPVRLRRTFFSTIKTVMLKELGHEEAKDYLCRLDKLVETHTRYRSESTEEDD